MSKTYKNIILTNHAQDRAKLRSISLNSIYQTIKSPEKKVKKDKDQFKFFKRISDRNYHVIASYLKEEKKWLVISVWVRGEDDKLPLVWRIIFWPFKIIFQIVFYLIKSIFNICKNCIKK